MFAWRPINREPVVEDCVGICFVEAGDPVVFGKHWSEAI